MVSVKLKDVEGISGILLYIWYLDRLWKLEMVMMYELLYVIVCRWVVGNCVCLED